MGKKDPQHDRKRGGDDIEHVGSEKPRDIDVDNDYDANRDSTDRDARPERSEREADVERPRSDAR